MGINKQKSQSKIFNPTHWNLLKCWLVPTRGSIRAVDISVVPCSTAHT